MSRFVIATIAVIWTVVAVFSILVVRWVWIRSRVSGRLAREEQKSDEQRGASQSEVNWWLFRAGFRSPTAPWGFLAANLIAATCSAALIYTFYAAGAVGRLTFVLGSIPGGVGDVFLPIAWGSPWIAGLVLCSIPALAVRARRRSRVASVEQDLPLCLDLLATLAEAGLSFDSALDRILESQPGNRPLSQDLQLFQLDVLAGQGRIESLRRLMSRVDVTWFSIFVSAVIHAEQVGSGLAQTLRTQAEDLRMRRRERALALAMSIPVKLVIPLVACFLPGLLIAAIGPMAFQIVKVLDQFMQQTTGR